MSNSSLKKLFRHCDLIEMGKRSKNDNGESTSSNLKIKKRIAVIEDEVSNKKEIDTVEIKKSKKKMFSDGSEIVSDKKPRMADALNSDKNNEEKGMKINKHKNKVIHEADAKDKSNKIKKNVNIEEFNTINETHSKINSKKTNNSKTNKNKESTIGEPKAERHHINEAHKPANINKRNKNKKIIFEEDTGEPREVLEVDKKNDQNNKDITEEVNDEDIDKFCDELTEEDNVQYENWVEIIEAYLKNKPK